MPPISALVALCQLLILYLSLYIMCRKKILKRRRVASASMTVCPCPFPERFFFLFNPIISPAVPPESFHDVDGNNEVLRSLQRQVMLLGEKIDTFAHERNVLSETLSQHQYESLHRPSDESSVEMEDLDVFQEVSLFRRCLRANMK